MIRLAEHPVGGARNVAGSTYLERGRPVVVLLAWGPGGGPRNVRIRREDGTEVVRPFRGLRRPPTTDAATSAAPARQEATA